MENIKDPNNQSPIQDIDLYFKMAKIEAGLSDSQIARARSLMHRSWNGSREDGSPVDDRFLRLNDHEIEELIGFCSLPPSERRSILNRFFLTDSPDLE